MCDELNTGQAQDWSKVVRITKDQVKRLAKGGGGGAAMKDHDECQRVTLLTTMTKTLLKKSSSG